MDLSLAVHVVGIILWIGGLMIVSTYLKSATAGGGEVLAAPTKKAWFGYVIPGFVMALLSGLYQISYRGMDFYRTQGWFHAKLTFVVLLIISTIMLSREVKRITTENQVNLGPVRAVQGITGLAFVVIVFLTILMKPH